MISTFHYQLKSVIGNDISVSFFVKYSTSFIPNSLHINTLSKARQYGLEITIFGTMCEYKTIIINQYADTQHPGQQNNVRIVFQGQDEYFTTQKHY